MPLPVLLPNSCPRIREKIQSAESISAAPFHKVCDFHLIMNNLPLKKTDSLSSSSNQDVNSSSASGRAHVSLPFHARVLAGLILRRHPQP